MVKVSVIMPVYNCEEYLKDSVESILNQTLDDLELICVDDGSDDNSLNILKGYEKQDSRVKVYSIGHAGAGNARNFALKHISGKYLYFMDADDVLYPNAFERFYPICEDKNLDFLMFKLINYDVVRDVTFEKDNYSMPAISKRVKDRVFNFHDVTDLILDINVTPTSKFYNTEFVISSKAQFKCGLKFEDNQFFWDIIFQAERIYFLDEFFYTRTVRPGSLMGSYGKNHCDTIEVNNDIIDLFKKHGQFENFKTRLLNRKIRLYMKRYGEIADEYKELFFLKMKQDFKRNEGSDFRSCLWLAPKFVYDGVMISKNHDEFKRLTEYYSILNLKDLQIPEKMSRIKTWFETLDRNQKMFAFRYIKRNLPREYRELFRQAIFRVSLIIPVYNAEDYLEDTFNSLLNQKIGFDNIQVIFIDNASTDSSPKIIEKYSKEHNNVISIFLDENSEYKGLSRNIGMRYANADYLMFMEPGDVFSPDACKMLYTQIQSQSYDVVCSVHSNSEKIPEYLGESFKSDERLNEEKFELKIKDIGEYPLLIKAANIGDMIFTKRPIDDDDIKFPVSLPDGDSVFILKALLNASSIKFINKIIAVRNYEKSISHNQYSKDKIIKQISTYFQMHYACLEKNRQDLFKQYLLEDKLSHLVEDILKCDLPTGEVLELLIYAQPLFKLYAGGRTSDNQSIFKDIADGDFESALRFIQGEDCPRLRDMKCVAAGCQIKGCINISDDWKNQFDAINPDLFIFKNHVDDEILNYCRNHNIKLVEWDGDCQNLNHILDSVNFKYIPDFRHLVLIYHLDDLRDLNDIINHFHSIDYPFKHLKMITSEENLFLKDAILESDLSNLDLADNYYYCFADLDFEFDDNAFCRNYVQ